MTSRNRNGLTFIEVVVVIATLLAIMALILPMVRSARGASRRTQCLNNARNCTLGIVSFASGNRGRLPAQASFPLTPATEGNRCEIKEGRSWVVDILPYLDYSGIRDRWNIFEPWNGQSSHTSHRHSNAALSTARIECLVCPEDLSAFQEPGGISYVVNCGIGDSHWKTNAGIRDCDDIEPGHHFLIEPFDWNGDGAPADFEDASVTRELMLFWPIVETFEDGIPKEDTRKPHRLGEIYDGSSNTFMFAENINAGTRPGNKRSSWADPQISSTGFLLPVKPHPITRSSHSVDGSLASYVVDKPFDPAINAARSAGEGLAPFPNSNHPGISAFAFCDGSGRMMSEKIDLQVYARLVTPCGTRLRHISGFVAETPLAREDH